MDKSATHTPTGIKFSRYEKTVIGILAFLQFTVILDFMIISPLGAIVMPSLHISPQQFGLAVSSYAFSAGVSGFSLQASLTAFDRKRLLLFFYFGFMLGTLLCALATTYPFLLLARIVTGLFGGVIGSVVFAITTDLFPLEMRGPGNGRDFHSFRREPGSRAPRRAVPDHSLELARSILAIIAIGVPAGIIIMLVMRPVIGHLASKQEHSPLRHLINTISEPRYRLAFLLVMLLPTGGYMLMPFGTAYIVNNVGLTFAVLPVIYLVTGLSTVFVGPLVGKASDSFGKFTMFCFGTIVGPLIMVPIWTHIGHVPLAAVIVINVILFAGIFSRMIPSQALLSAIPEPTKRGAFRLRQRFIAAIRRWGVVGGGRLAHRSEAGRFSGAL